jgi:predicted RNA binding protein YcfA (HicA-like mRNA interferase family)
MVQIAACYATLKEGSSTSYEGPRHDQARGSHRQYKHPMKPGTVTIPGHPSEELQKGTERSILRQAGLHEEEES